MLLWGSPLLKGGGKSGRKFLLPPYKDGRILSPLTIFFKRGDIRRVNLGVILRKIVLNVLECQFELPWFCRVQFKVVRWQFFLGTLPIKLLKLHKSTL